MTGEPPRPLLPASSAALSPARPRLQPRPPKPTFSVPVPGCRQQAAGGPTATRHRQAGAAVDGQAAVLAAAATQVRERRERRPRHSVSLAVLCSKETLFKQREAQAGSCPHSSKAPSRLPTVLCAPWPLQRGGEDLCQPGDHGEDLHQGGAPVPHGRLCLLPQLAPHQVKRPQRQG